MKRFIIILLLSLFSFIGYSQNIQRNQNEDVKVTINISKISKTIGKVVNVVTSEVQEYKKDIDECLPGHKETMDSLKVQTVRGMKQVQKEMHRGFRQGLRGEKYDPNKD